MRSLVKRFGVVGLIVFSIKGLAWLAIAGLGAAGAFAH